MDVNGGVQPSAILGNNNERGDAKNNIYIYINNNFRRIWVKENVNPLFEKKKQR